MRAVMKTETKTVARALAWPSALSALHGLFDCVAQVTGVAAVEARGLSVGVKCCNHLRRRSSAADGCVA